MHRKGIRFVGIAIAAFSLCGCASISTMHTQTVPDKAYREALDWTSPDHFNLPEPGSEAERAMLDGVRSLFENYNRDNLADNATKVYAERLYFRDAFKRFDTAEAVRDYLVEGMKPLEAGEFKLKRFIRSEAGDYYIDWLMRLDFKSTPTGTWEESIGMTHIRFNDEGKVIFHQDYWDPTDIVYRRIPLAKQLIAYVKKKM